MICGLIYNENSRISMFHCCQTERCMLLEFLLSYFFHTEILLILLVMNKFDRLLKDIIQLSIDWTVYVFQAVGITFIKAYYYCYDPCCQAVHFFLLLLGKISRGKSSAHWYQLNILFFSFRLSISFILWCSVFRNLYISLHLTWKGLAASFVEEKPWIRLICISDCNSSLGLIASSLSEPS